MAEKLRTVRITAQMITNLELTMNVPADMPDADIHEKYKIDGEIDGGDLTEPKDDPGDWEWGDDVESCDFDPNAPTYFTET